MTECMSWLHHRPHGWISDVFVLLTEAGKIVSLRGQTCTVIQDKGLQSACWAVLLHIVGRVGCVFGGFETCTVNTSRRTVKLTCFSKGNLGQVFYRMNGEMNENVVLFYLFRDYLTGNPVGQLYYPRVLCLSFKWPVVKIFATPLFQPESDLYRPNFCLVANPNRKS